MTLFRSIRSAINCEPQLEQNQRSFPGDDSNALIRSWPFVQRKLWRGTAAMDEKAAPCALRQLSQWQWPIGPIAESTA